MFMIYFCSNNNPHIFRGDQKNNIGKVRTLMEGTLVYRIPLRCADSSLSSANSMLLAVGLAIGPAVRDISGARGSHIVDGSLDRVGA